MGCWFVNLATNAFLFSPPRPQDTKIKLWRLLALCLGVLVALWFQPVADPGWEKHVFGKRTILSGGRIQFLLQGRLLF
jgi:hypothetical protein